MQGVMAKGNDTNKIEQAQLTTGCARADSSRDVPESVLTSSIQ
jgi:hypothetical protein